MKGILSTQTRLPSLPIGKSSSHGSTSRTKAQESSLGQANTFAKIKEVDSSKTSGTLSATSSTPKERPASKVVQKPTTAEDKKAQALAQKKAFDDRFKKRGKRPLPPREDGETDSAKRPKRELSAYEKEVQKYESRILKDQGSGVRSVMK